MVDSAIFFKQGAESRLYIGLYNGQECIIKKRFAKKYRHPELDLQLTKERVRAEVRAATRCAKAEIISPKIYSSDISTGEIYMEYFKNAVTVKEFLTKLNISLSGSDQLTLSTVAQEIGMILGKMHENNIIHGDLTTSNVLVNPTAGNFSEFDLILIDFGLSQYSTSAEQKAVDLYVLERAITSSHSNLEDLFSLILNSYEKYNKQSSQVIMKLEEVRSRGRKRTMVG